MSNQLKHPAIDRITEGEDRWRCRYCGREATLADIHADTLCPKAGEVTYQQAVLDTVNLSLSKGRGAN